MAYLASNEPYQRVSQDNNVFDGALIGMAVGAGGAGAGVFGTRMHYNGIDNRVKRQIDDLQGELEYRQARTDRAQRKVENYKGNPRFYERRGYNRGNQAEAEILNQGRIEEEIINNNRKSRIENLQNQTAGEIDNIVDDVMNRYPNANPDEIRRYNINANATRNQYKNQVNEINDYYDDQIRQAQQNTVENLNGNQDVQYRNKVNERINQRIDKRHQNWMNAVDKEIEVAQKLAQVSAPDYLDSLRQNHVYSKLGGWRNAAIIGASAVIGGGLGMVSDHLSDSF